MVEYGACRNGLYLVLAVMVNYICRNSEYDVFSKLYTTIFRNYIKGIVAYMQVNNDLFYS